MLIFKASLTRFDRRRIGLAVLVLMFALTSAASAKSKPSQGPVISDGAFFPEAKWNDPSVLRVDGQFVMYASAGKGFSGDIDIYRLESADGARWNLSPAQPVLENSIEPNAFDRKAVETPSVVIFKGTYHMFYTAYPNDFMDVKNYTIMHATSQDGIVWKKDPTPLVSPTDPSNTTPNLQFNQWITAEPGALVFNDQLYLYFVAVGANRITQSDLATIGLIISRDGQNWSEPQMTLMPDQGRFPRKDYRGFTTPAATVREGRVELFFTALRSDVWKGRAIYRAASTDGIGDWKIDAKPVLVCKKFPWASEEIGSPSPLYVGNELHLWFAGNSQYQLGIGLYKKETKP